MAEAIKKDYRWNKISSCLIRNWIKLTQWSISNGFNGCYFNFFFWSNLITFVLNLFYKLSKHFVAFNTDALNHTIDDLRTLIHPHKQKACTNSFSCWYNQFSSTSVLYVSKINVIFKTCLTHEEFSPRLFLNLS